MFLFQKILTYTEVELTQKLVLTRIYPSLF